MKLIMKRQRGSAEAPSALEYGELALTKAGELYAGDESGAAVRVTAGAERRAENIAYDVKILQLMRILEDAEPAMLAGFIEGFRDRSKTALAQNVTFDTANHRLKFDGKALSGGSGAESEVTASVTGPGYTSRLAAGSYSNVVARPQGKMVQAIQAFPQGEFTGGVVDGCMLYAGMTPEACDTPVAEFSYENIGGVISCGEAAVPAAMQQYDYFRIELIALTPAGATDGLYAASPGETGSFESAAWAGSAVMRCAELVYSPADGSYQSIPIALGAAVTGGELYLHYAALPEGAALVPKVQIGSGAFAEVTAEYTGRDVTIGGVALKEDRYRASGTAAGETAAVRIDGSRAAADDSLVLYDVLFAGR